MKKEIIYKRVRSLGTSGMICVPKTLIGQNVEIHFFRKLTEKEKELIRKHNLKQKLERIKKLKDRM